MPERDFRCFVRSCVRVTVTKVEVAEGKGSDGDPVRLVAYFYDDDGWLIARRDAWEEQRDAETALTSKQELPS